MQDINYLPDKESFWEEYQKRLLCYGTVFTVTYIKDHKCFVELIENDKVKIDEQLS